MANYQNLKAAISAAIRTNGNQEITGQVLQNVLNSIVSVIGANYTFAGVATPATNPGTPDQNVFYIATQGGTYTNFGATALPEGISLLMWNGSWRSETVMYGDGGVFDISVYKSSGGTLAMFADLAAALDGGNNIPASARKGGMSVKFVQSSDNNYVQFRLMHQYFTTDTTKWQGVDDEPTAGSRNLVKSGGVVNAIKDSEIVDGGVTTKDELSFVDEEDNCIAQFKEGHIKTKNFNSKDSATKSYVGTSISVAKTEIFNKVAEVDNEEEIDEELAFVDESGNCPMLVSGGHIKTKNFDSRNAVNPANIDNPEEDDESLSLVDENNNCIAQFKDGHIKTRKFDSRKLENKRFASIGIDDLTVTGTSSISESIITLQSGIANKVFLNATIHGWHYKMIQTVKFNSGTPNIVIGKDDSNYGTYIEIEGSSLKIVNNNEEKTHVSIGFTLQTDRDYTIVWDYNVTTVKRLTVEIYNNFGNYFTYTTDYTVHAYGRPYTYSKSAVCSITKWAMTMQHSYNPVTSKMIVAGHSYVEADSLGSDRTNCFTNLLDEYNGEGTVVNCGLGGDSVDTMNKKLPYYIKMNPNVEYIFGCIGRNDGGLTYAQFVEQLTSFIGICTMNNIKPILTTIEPDKTGYNNAVMPDVNTWIRSSGYLYVDIDKVFHNADGTINTSLYLTDGIHPTVEGHLRIYRRIQMDCPFLF